MQEELVKDQIEQAFLKIYFKLNQTELSDLAHSPEDTIKDCSAMGGISNQCKKTMNGQKANRVMIPRYGVCYLHNFEQLNSGIRPEGVGSSGPDYGLQLVFNINSHYYMRYGLSRATGILLTLNDPQTMPLVLSKPILLGTNIKTGIKVLKEVITRQKAPYVTNCSDHYPPEYLNTLPFDPTKVNYNMEYCKAVCRVKYIEKTCGCTDPLMMEATFLDEFSTKEYNFCSVEMESDQRTCVREQMIQYSSELGDQECLCQPNCYEESYEVPNF